MVMDLHQESSTTSVTFGDGLRSATAAETTTSINRCRRNKSVRFACGKESVYTYDQVPSKQNIWYSDSDYMNIEYANEKLARKFLKGKLKEGNPKETYRGLECYDTDDFKRRLEVSGLSIVAVLQEQMKQRQLGVHDPLAIAVAYQRTGTSHCQEKAIIIGQKDFNSRSCCKDDTAQSSLNATKTKKKHLGIIKLSLKRLLLLPAFRAMKPLAW